MAVACNHLLRNLLLEYIILSVSTPVTYAFRHDVVHPVMHVAFGIDTIHLDSVQDFNDSNTRHSHLFYCIIDNTS